MILWAKYAIHSLSEGGVWEPPQMLPSRGLLGNYLSFSPFYEYCSPRSARYIAPALSRLHASSEPVMRTLRWQVCVAAIAVISTGHEAKAQRDGARQFVQVDLSEALHSDEAFADPETLRSAGGVLRTTLNAELSRVTLNDDRVELRLYEGRLTGPTLRVRRGDKLKVRLRNWLPDETKRKASAQGNQEFLEHLSEITNLHTHGLNVSPKSPADNVFHGVNPGDSYRFVFRIPDDHPSGTFWYHPHYHGSVAFHVTSGMAGALIVEGRRGDDRWDLEDLNEVRTARERLLVLQQFLYRIDSDGIGRLYPEDVLDVPSDEAIPWLTVNGKVMPVIEMRPGEVERWRFIHAGRQDLITLEMHDVDDNLTTDLPFHELAIDGLATGRLDHEEAFELVPGSRWDVLVKAPLSEGIYLLTSAELSAEESLRAIPVAQQYIAKVVVKGRRNDMPLPNPQKLKKCAPFESIDRSDVVRQSQLEFDMSLDDAPYFHIDNESFDHQVKRTLYVNEAEEWTLRSARGSHPFHIHVNPFEVVLEQDADGNVLKSEWRDTVRVRNGRPLTIRMRPLRHTGTTVLHCHILDHEDRGMMQAIRIERRSKGPPPVTTSAEPITMPDWQLVDYQLKPRSAKEIAGRRCLVVLFNGLGCRHCVEQLTNLLRRRAELAGQGVALVAVSSELLDEQITRSAFTEAELRSLMLLQDPDRKLFEALGCFAEGTPLHGTFVVAADGSIAWSHIGDTPFDDAGAVLARFRSSTRAAD
jgi:FtsP/CotA-like multicopper oxidase with cupredoxin domain/peroxiredoxin